MSRKNKIMYRAVGYDTSDPYLSLPGSSAYVRDCYPDSGVQDIMANHTAITSSTAQSVSHAK
ncbi:hypothetical protein PILCRDRAFT_813146 [Piloderma croceum F 1598]|uniref:Uncharacterized protein n=1 Tax=Piloderma croceum (strain F 1598) TaxID=765440 RepID=A0A0C3BRT7_PILCF|nr:hypothetical protein PILCRDRAFT_813146 [Piloderma croceum F 1598]